MMENKYHPGCLPHNYKHETASAGTGGTISPTGAVSVDYGANQPFTITANTGYSISNVTVDGVSQGAISSYTFNNVTAAHTIAPHSSITIRSRSISFENNVS